MESDNCRLLKRDLLALFYLNTRVKYSHIHLFLLSLSHMKLYNTLTKNIEEIEKKDHTNMYSCGPTVYNYAHIGNLRSFIMADLLYRTLKLDGYNPKWVINITDIDDKTIKGALEKYGKEAGVKELYEYTQFYLDEFLQDLREVNVLVDEIDFIRVTDVMSEIQEFIVSLLEKGFAYTAEDGSVYFNIEKYQQEVGDYGALVGEKFLEGKKVGARVKVDEYEKDSLSDFALWKAWDEADGNIFWEHKTLGKGRPGWHIECSVVNKVAFGGEAIDIHTGGVDLIFPHHTNEIAQSEALLGKGNFVKHWMHSEHLLVDGKKMSKSAGNFFTLRDLKVVTPLAGSVLRFLFLQSNYRSQQNFTQDSFISASHGFSGLKNTLGHENNLSLDPLKNDLNSAKSIAESSSPSVYFELLGEKNVEDVLPEQIVELQSRRNQAREVKDFTASDILRKQIEDLGFEVKDTPEGQKIQKKI